MFSYGKVYSKLPYQGFAFFDRKLEKNSLLGFFAKIYFYLFGYPDVASQRRYKMVEKILDLKRGDKILDAGCGNGIYLHELTNKYGVLGLGVDSRVKRVQIAQKVNKLLGFRNKFLTSTLEKLDLGRSKFDKIICLEVLEHIEDDSRVLKKLTRHLIKGGLFVISIPMKGTALTKEQENDPYFKPKKYEHVRSGYVRRDLQRLAKSADLKIISIDEYFFLVSRYAVKFQQMLYKKNMFVFNLLFSPLLTFISGLDSYFKFYPRGYLMVLKKNAL